MTRIPDCIFLSLFWMVGCIPVITIGASFAALYDATYRGFRKGERHCWSRFLQVFRQNWKSGILPTGVFLLDSVTAIMENEMFQRVESTNNGLKGSNHIEIVYDETAKDRVKADMVAFAKATGNTVFVSDGIYGDMGEYSQSTEDYRKALAAVDRALAGACDNVVEITYGMEEVWK
jgi:adenosyl cobinamide kinase/adenosyl cobinamide phosphate guanylyltransferase